MPNGRGRSFYTKNIMSSPCHRVSRSVRSTEGNGPRRIPDRGSPFFSRTLRKGWNSTVLSPLGFGCRLRGSQQAHRQPSAQNHIKRQTETGPPIRYSGVCNKPAMDGVKTPWPTMAGTANQRLLLKPSTANSRHPLATAISIKSVRGEAPIMANNT